MGSPFEVGGVLEAEGALLGIGLPVGSGGLGGGRVAELGEVAGPDATGGGVGDLAAEGWWDEFW